MTLPRNPTKLQNFKTIAMGTRKVNDFNALSYALQCSRKDDRNGRWMEQWEGEKKQILTRIQLYIPDRVYHLRIVKSELTLNFHLN